GGPRGAVGAGRQRARRSHHPGRQPHGHPPAERQAPPGLFRHRAYRLHAHRLRRGLRQWRGHDALLSRGLPLREHGRLPGGGGGIAVGRLRSDRRLQGARPALARSGAGHAALSPFPGWHPVRGRLLGEALCLLGRRRQGTLLAGAPGRDSHRGGALLLPLGGQEDVHRRAGAPRAHRGLTAAGAGHPHLQPGRGRHGHLSQALRSQRASRRRHVILGGMAKLARLTACALACGLLVTTSVAAQPETRRFPLADPKQVDAGTFFAEHAALLASNPSWETEEMRAMGGPEQRAALADVAGRLPDDLLARELIRALDAVRSAELTIRVLRGLFPDEPAFLAQIDAAQHMVNLPDGSVRRLPLIQAWRLQRGLARMSARSLAMRGAAPTLTGTYAGKA